MQIEGFTDLSLTLFVIDRTLCGSCDMLCLMLLDA